MILILFQVIIIVGASRPRQKPILRVKLSTTSPETIKNISQSRRKKTVESDVSLTPPPHPHRQKSVDGVGQRRRGIFLNERKVLEFDNSTIVHLFDILTIE